MISSDFPRRFSPSLARIWLHIILRSVAAAAAVIILAAAAANVAAISLARRDNSFHSFVSISLRGLGCHSTQGKGHFEVEVACMHSGGSPNLAKYPVPSSPDDVGVNLF